MTMPGWLRTVQAPFTPFGLARKTRPTTRWPRKHPTMSQGILVFRLGRSRGSRGVAVLTALLRLRGGRAPGRNAPRFPRGGGRGEAWERRLKMERPAPPPKKKWLGPFLLFFLGGGLLV